MRNWYDIIEPHQDIKNEEFSMDVFAADIGDVVEERAPIDYTDPDMFSRKTYFTDGLENLLRKVHRKLSEGRGDSIIELKTPFGGGKTHSLISIYHYIKNGNKIKSLLPKDLDIIDAGIAVLACDHLNPQEGREIDGLNIRTLWGELAYQIGGEEGYEQFKENDQNRISPGSEKLTEFLTEQQPFVLLFDEVLEYIAGALGVEYAKSNLGSQSFTFLTQLTKAMGSIKNGMLVVTLPSSDLEDFTPEKEKGLARLEKIFGRVETIETPVKGDEVYSIIRRRLFQDMKSEEKKNEVIHEYFEMYRNNKEDVPNKVRDKDYKERMDLAYPFHPETIDILYEKWGTFSSFQRTRGVLRLLALLIGDLYKGEKNIDMILPSDINLDNSAIREEFIKHIGTEYDAIIAADISGPDAKAQAMDKENREWGHLAEKISTATFMHSFTAQERELGIGLPHIKLTTLRPDIRPAMVTEVKEKLRNNLWYLNEKDGSYYFSEIPNLNRMVRDKRELYDEDEIIDKLYEIVKEEVGNKFRSYIWPKKSKDIPDNKELKLIILHPGYDENDIDDWTKKKGDGFRTYKNTLIFAVPDAQNYGDFKENIREYLALKEIKEDVEIGETESLKGKLPEIKERMKRLEDDFSYNVRQTYNKIKVKEDEIDLGMPIAGKESLSNWYKRELTDREEIISNLHYRPIVRKFLGEKEKIATSRILEQYYKDRDLSMIESDDVLKNAIIRGIEDEKLGVAMVEDGEMIENTLLFGVSAGQEDINFDEEECLLKGSFVEKLTCSECGALLKDGECPKCEIDEKEITKKEDVKDIEEKDESEKERTKLTKYKGLKLEIGNIPSSKIAALSRGVFMPLTNAYGEFSFKIYLELEDEEGISEKELEEKVRETLRQIGAEIIKEEKEE